MKFNYGIICLSAAITLAVMHAWSGDTFTNHDLAVFLTFVATGCICSVMERNQ